MDIHISPLVVVLAIVIAVAWFMMQGGKVPTILNTLIRTMTQSSQLPVGLAVVLLGAHDRELGDARSRCARAVS